MFYYIISTNSVDQNLLPRVHVSDGHKGQDKGLQLGGAITKFECGRHVSGKMSKDDRQKYVQAVFASSQTKTTDIVKTMTPSAQTKIAKKDNESLFPTFGPRTLGGGWTSAPAESAMHQLKTAHIRDRDIYRSLVTVAELRCREYDEKRRKYIQYTTQEATKNETITPYALKHIVDLGNELIKRPMTVTWPTPNAIQNAGTSTLTNVSLLPFVNKSKGNIVVHLLAHGPIAIRQPVLNATCSRHSKMDGSSNNETE